MLPGVFREVYQFHCLPDSFEQRVFQGFRFTDYWRLGLPLDVLVVAVSVPLLLLVWPL